MNKKNIVIGSRGSQLALCQANWAKETLSKAFPQLNVTLKIIKTKGDKIQDVALAMVGGKGLFVKEIEDALLAEEIDLAVHSMKDVPTDLPPELFIAAVTEREDPRDVLISRDKISFKDLKEAAVIGTSSLRRQSQLFHIKPDMKIIPLRGNLDTRLRKLTEGTMDGIIVAAAGLKRMGWADQITEYLPFEVCLPAVGQGALGIEARRGDNETLSYLQQYNHEDTYWAVTAERACLKKLEGGCQVPIAVYASVKNNLLFLEGFVGSVDGKRIIRDKEQGTIKTAQDLGNKLADKLIARGAGEILKEIYRS